MASRVNCVEELMAVLGDAASERDAVLGPAGCSGHLAGEQASCPRGDGVTDARQPIRVLARVGRLGPRVAVGGEVERRRGKGVWCGRVTCGTVRKEFVFGQKHFLAINFYGSLSSPTFLEPDRWA